MFVDSYIAQMSSTGSQVSLEEAEALRDSFRAVKGFKPAASRSISREMYVIAQEHTPADR